MELNKPQMIRFIDSKYNDLFSISDGENITVTNRFGEKNTHNCKFIDEYHTQIDGTVFHICEFAERMEERGATYAPAERVADKGDEGFDR